MTTKKIMTLSLILTAIMTLPINGVGQTLSSKKEKNSLKAGSWALQFQIEDGFSRIFGVEDFQGTTISIKKHSSDGSAIRLGLTLDFDIDNSDIENQTDSIIFPTGEQDSDAQRVRIAIQSIHYRTTNENVSLFYGFGPLGEFRRFKSSSFSPRSNGSSDFRSSFNQSWTVGFVGLIGVEYFPHRRIGILVEYASEMIHTWSKNSSDSRSVSSGGTIRTTHSERDQRSFDFQAQSIKLGLSLYF